MTRSTRRTINSGLFLGLMGIVCLALSDEYKPDFQPNYRPVTDSDEGGLWYVIDKQEEQVKTSPHRIRDPELNRYIHDLVCDLSGEYCSGIRVYIMKNPHFNASMAPNGMMQVWSGLFLRLSNEAELAAVLGHEIAHYLRAHTIKRWRTIRETGALAVWLDVGLGLVTGVHGLASLGLMSGAMAYNRGQEEEADRYGLQLLVDHRYAPEAPAQLWHTLEIEREADQSKSSSSFFFATHPDIEDRAEYLEQQARVLTKPEIDYLGRSHEAYVERVTPYYYAFMQNHLELQEYEQTESLLKLHRELGYPAHLTDHFSGELYRLRNLEGDQERALESYQAAVESPQSLAVTHKNFGYMLMKQKQSQLAREQFQLYLDKNPSATDAEMIRFYLQTLESS